MDEESERKLLITVGQIKSNQDHHEKRMDRLMDLLTPKIEKWDAAHFKASALYRAAMTVVTSTIVGGVAFLFFR